MLSIVCVGLGGFIGSVARYVLGLVCFEGDFPLMTFLINFLGAVVIGVVFEVSSVYPNTSSNAILFLKTGICGGFTTFSTFSLETLLLIEQGKYAMGALYACGSVVVCVIGVMLGRLMVQAARVFLTGAK